MAAKNNSITMDEKLWEQIDSRTNKNAGQTRSGLIIQDLQDHWSLLDMGLRQARQILTRNEAKLVVDILNGVFIGPGEYLTFWASGGLHHDVQDGIDLNGLGEKWGIDRASILSKIAEMDNLTIAGLVDWGRRMWSKFEDNALWEQEFKKFPEAHG